MHLPVGRRTPAGLFAFAAAVSWPFAGAHAAAIEAVSADGRYRIQTVDEAGILLVRSGADGRELRRIPLVDRDRRPGRLAWILDLPRRQSFLAGFEGLPEAWELSYSDKAEPVYDGLVHDYRMGEGIAERGPLPVRRIPLAAPLPLPVPDERQVHVAWADPTLPGKLNVLNLDVRRIVAQVDAPTKASSPPAPAPAPKPADGEPRTASAPSPAAMPRIDSVRVVAAVSRVDETLEAVPATVTVIDRAEAFREVAGNLRDLLRYEPGVSFENGATRFGLGNLNIRGLDGNRVQMTVDGIRLPESYKVGSFSSASRNALGLGMLRQVEIVRGPASAIHGSDALAGVVAFQTLDPGTYLRGNRTHGGEVFAGQASADESVSRGAVLAIGSADMRFLLATDRVDGEEAANRGDVGGTGAARTLPNPQSARSESQLAKWVIPTRGGWRYTLTAERYAREVATDVLSLNPQSPRTASLSGSDRARRDRYSVEALTYDTGPFSRLAVTAYSQASLTQQDTEELRVNTTAACLSAAGSVRCLREPRFRFETVERGLVAIGTSRSPWGGIADAFVMGLEASRTRAEESRDGRQTNLVTGAVTNVVGGELMPTRDFPLTDTDRMGAFVQDSLAGPDARLTVIPGLRFDAFRITPRADESFRPGANGRPVASLSDRAFSPRVGALFRPVETLTFTGQFATGFRAPPAADLNIGLSSLPAGYAVVPNPELTSERSRGVELGARVARGPVEAMVTGFYSRYHDLIVSRAALACPADPACVAGATGTFQSRNIASARISGVEAKVSWRFAKGWTARAAVSRVVGDDLSKDAPLNSVDPPRLVAGIGYEAARWGATVHGTHAWEQTRVDRAAGVAFVPPAWTTLDVTAWWKPWPALEVAAGVFNVADRKYWQWSDVRGLAGVTGAFDRYTQPGRSFGVNGRWTY